MQINKINNTQNFGMAFKLEGNGAKKLIELLPNPGEMEHFEKTISKPLEYLDADVVYNGEDVFVKAKNSETLKLQNKSYLYQDDLMVPQTMYYPLSNERYIVEYKNESQKEKIFSEYRNTPKLSPFIAAREIAKDLSAKLAK